MTLEFQESLLKYLLQSKEAKKYVSFMDESAFDKASWKITFELLKAYVKQYKAMPTRSNMLRWWEKEIQVNRSKELTQEFIDEVTQEIRRLYIPQETEVNFIQEEIIEFAQKKRLKRLLIKNADKIDQADDKFISAFLYETNKIGKLKEVVKQGEGDSGHFLIKERDQMKSLTRRVIPTGLQGLDALTSAGGFYAPQLIVFMKAAKVFGTGFLLYITWLLVMQGYNVFYADAENGLASLYNRLYMTILKCEDHEVKANMSILKRILALAEKMGAGDMKFHYFDGGVSSMADVDDKLEELKMKYNWQPDFIILDYVDKFVPIDKTIKLTKPMLTAVYQDAVRLNKKWQCPMFTISPVTSDASENWVLKPKDFGDDKYKAYNCHASFAICRAPEELRMKTARIIPVVQREGTPYLHNWQTTVALEIDEKTASVTELDSEAYWYSIQDHMSGKKKAGESIKMVPLSQIKDE